MSKVKWGILGAGAIAQAFARAAVKSSNATIQAVASRDLAKASKFAAEYSIPVAHGSYDALLADKDIQAIYVCVPHPMHAEWAIKAANAGKHLIVEKPIAVNQFDLLGIIEAAKANNVFLMEAFMYRCHPQTSRLVELLKEKVIGEVRLIVASFGFQAGFNAESRLFKNDLAGGGILDVGCYAASMARLIAAAAQGKDCIEPTEVKACGHLGQTGIDEWATASLKFPGEIVAQISTSVLLNQENAVRIFGSEGNIYLQNPWVCNRQNPETTKIIVRRNGEKEPREITCEATGTSFQYEIERASAAILAGEKQVKSPAMSWDDSLGNLRTLDRWRDSIGLLYNIEKPEGFRKTTVSGSPLNLKKGNMIYGQINGLDRKVSRLVFGCDNQQFFSHGALMWDDFVERGGNTFDTAFIYGGGRQEINLGHWMKLRGVRDQLNIICKGGHTPFCTPKDISAQLKTSLERMQISSAEIYIMHRDNLDVPVGEFVDVLNEHVRAGRIKVFGGSNWSLARVQEANEYAAKKNLQGFGVISNNFSLARMVKPIWGGCIHSSDSESRAWLLKHQIPILSWSSQARGFFLPGRAAPDKLDDAELVNTWYSTDNFARLQRTVELAKKKGVEAIHIALAYVLHQPFPTYALVGPRKPDETASSFRALDVQLTADEVKWLYGD